MQQQPTTEEEKLRAYAAMVACPVGSIRTYEPDPLAKEAQQLFPAAIDRSRIPAVHHLGFHSADSFGAAPYFIQRPRGQSISSEAIESISEGRCSGELLSEQGYANVIIDSPRFNSKCVLLLLSLPFMLAVTLFLMLLLLLLLLLLVLLLLLLLLLLLALC